MTLLLQNVLAGRIALARNSPEIRAAILAADVPSDDAIRKILIDRAGRNENDVGIIVKIVTPTGERVISHGRRYAGDARPLDGDTVFEIGSVTKVFTALLLANAVQRKEATLGDPVAKYLPPGVSVRTRNGRPITLLDLATHTSGLFMPEDAPPLNDPAAAKYSAADLARFVANYNQREMQKSNGTIHRILGLERSARPAPSETTLKAW